MPKHVPVTLHLYRHKPRRVRRPLRTARRVNFQHLTSKNVVPLGKRHGKYGAVSCTYNGRVFASRLEANYAQQLDMLRKAVDPKERVVDVQYQVNVDLVVNGQKICRYIPDFLVTFADGRQEYHETKGYPNAVWPIKEKLFRALFPDRILKVIR